MKTFCLILLLHDHSRISTEREELSYLGIVMGQQFLSGVNPSIYLNRNTDAVQLKMHGM